MDLKDSKTNENLKTAFIGEAIARCKYMYYAERAREEGMENLALAYEKASRNEQEHGKLWFERYHGILSKDENLKDAIKGETYESEDMYLKFAETARKEGFNDIAILFEHVAKIEDGHKKMFEKYLGSNVAGIDKWQCSKCGYIHTDSEAPKRCPVCEQYRVGGVN
ncbi:rubrerythrin family protein [Brachyspira hampsonii]|uniref:Rubrerythrin n=1 Tax=Brachyspira hampsonii 30446 TaxID=1289135 RepID=A0A2U4EY34_9SPIR|nr:ferritin family protein [Brachyspira hampsonii]EKV58276.1 rubrerythrin [Brachyspira hampsonii 30446]MBW5388875.1 rubrerythrin [Brachyspira hampsonii]MBW5393479.1 rubrerythrin [Brachyspira hampsonii]OEJ20552.1 rubrerythrin [Brachyspira hampsonii]PTY39328.1 rubrerythrin [Brachyspira hampsonii bv. II]